MPHLPNEVGRVLLGVRPLLDDPVEELAASDPGERNEKVRHEIQGYSTQVSFLNYQFSQL